MDYQITMAQATILEVVVHIQSVIDGCSERS